MGCNGYNHSPNCDCGFGGDTHNSSEVNNGHVSSHVVASSATQALSQLTVQERLKATYLIDCWWCQAKVFFHTNGNQDVVLFDELGAPWLIHDCWKEYWKEKRQSLYPVKEERNLNALTQQVSIPLRDLQKEFSYRINISFNSARHLSQQGTNIKVPLKLSYNEGFLGGKRIISFSRKLLCQECSGLGVGLGKYPSICPTCKGGNYKKPITDPSFGTVCITVCPTCQGYGLVIKNENKCEVCNGEGRITAIENLPFNIHPKTNSGIHPVRGYGNAGKYGGPYGDLILDISVKEYSEQ